MAFASVFVEPNERKCSICHELFTEPKLLPCGHLLCRHCLVSLMKTRKEAICSLCQCVITEGEQRALQSPEDIADGFPTDLAMEELVKAQRVCASKEYTCRLCENVAATYFCVHCEDMMCEACKKEHGTLSMFKNHIVKHLSSVAAEKLAANRPSTCSAHSDKTPKFYCPSHDASICSLCASSKHRSCPEVTNTEEKVEVARAKLAELTATLSAGETKLDRAIGQLDQHLQDTEKRTQAAIAQIEETCDRLESAIKSRLRNFREEALSTVAVVKRSAGTACLSQLQGKLASHQCVIQHAQKMKSRLALITLTSTLQTRVTELDCGTNLQKDSSVVSKITAKVPERSMSNIQQWLLTLGHVKVVPYKIFASVREVICQKPITFRVKVSRCCCCCCCCCCSSLPTGPEQCCQVIYRTTPILSYHLSALLSSLAFSLAEIIPAVLQNNL